MTEEASDLILILESMRELSLLHDPFSLPLKNNNKNASVPPLRNANGPSFGETAKKRP